MRAKPSLYLILLCVLKCILLVSEESPPTWVTWDYTVSSADDQPWSQGAHSQLYWGPARESGTTHPVLLRTSPRVRDHTASSTDDQPGSQGPHSQLCWGPAQESKTIQPTLLRNRLGVRDHTANSADDQPGNHGPHGLLCWETAWESGTTAPLCDQLIEEWKGHIQVRID